MRRVGGGDLEVKEAGEINEGEEIHPRPPRKGRSVAKGWGGW